MSDTPQTDAELMSLHGKRLATGWYVTGDFARQLERELTAWETELSKVMPPDYKDWWQNDKREWPLVARLVIEGKNRHAELDAAAYDKLERDLAAAKERADSEVNKRVTANIDRNFTQLELAAERALADRLAAALAVYKGDVEHVGHWMPAPAQNKADEALAAWKASRTNNLEGPGPTEQERRENARAELAKLKATLADPAEVELAMIRGHIAIPDRVEFDGIRETKNQTETAMLESRPSNDSPDVHETDFVNITTPCVCGFCGGTYCNHGI